MGLALAAGFLPAEELPRGRLIERIVTSADPDQSYAIYLPSGYSPERKWPILYALDPQARGHLPVQRFAAAAEKHGFLVAGSNNARNGPLDAVRAAIEAIYVDTHQRLSIDDAQMYVAGFSGGARVALAWARNGVIAGAVVCGAAFGAEVPQQIPPKVYFAAGVDDFNYYEMHRASRELAKRNAVQRFVEYSGGHEWLPEELAADALAFFKGESPPGAARDLKHLAKAAAKYEELMEALLPGNSAREDLAARLKRQAAAAQDSWDRRVARQVLEGGFLSGVEQGHHFLAQKRYPAAIAAWSTAALLRPENAMVWYSLAKAHAAAGNTNSALNALERAIEAGFRDAAAAEREPLFASIRRFLRYRVLLDRIS